MLRNCLKKKKKGKSIWAGEVLHIFNRRTILNSLGYVDFKENQGSHRDVSKQNTKTGDIKVTPGKVLVTDLDDLNWAPEPNSPVEGENQFYKLSCGLHSCGNHASTITKHVIRTKQSPHFSVEGTEFCTA